MAPAQVVISRASQQQLSARKTTSSSSSHTKPATGNKTSTTQSLSSMTSRSPFKPVARAAHGSCAPDKEPAASIVLVSARHYSGKNKHSDESRDHSPASPREFYGTITTRKKQKVQRKNIQDVGNGSRSETEFQPEKEQAAAVVYAVESHYNNQDPHDPQGMNYEEYHRTSASASGTVSARNEHAGGSLGQHAASSLEGTQIQQEKKPTVIQYHYKTPTINIPGKNASVRTTTHNNWAAAQQPAQIQAPSSGVPFYRTPLVAKPLFDVVQRTGMTTNGPLAGHRDKHVVTYR
ncbi:unnamed protein product [Amoebophrya sp. A120]|nr:unnamed protein product [Amoebophrya sp. A120]|eukprot:GSA120T00019975001.1